MNKRTYSSPAIKVREMVRPPLLTDSLIQGDPELDNPTEAEAKQSLEFLQWEDPFDSSPNY